MPLLLRGHGEQRTRTSQGEREAASSTLARILARKEGLLALEAKLHSVDDAFFAKGIQLVIDGFSADTVRDIMELEAEWERQRHETGKKNPRPAAPRRDQIFQGPHDARK